MIIVKFKKVDSGEVAINPERVEAIEEVGNVTNIRVSGMEYSIDHSFEETIDMLKKSAYASVWPQYT